MRISIAGIAVVAIAVVGIRVSQASYAAASLATLYSVLKCLTDAQPDLPAGEDWRTLTPEEYRRLMPLLHTGSLDMGHCRWNADGLFVDPWGTPLRISIRRDEASTRSFQVQFAGPDRTHGTLDDVLTSYE